MPEENQFTLQERIEAIKQRYEPRIQALKEKGEQLGDDYETPSTIGAIINVDFKVDWKDEEFIFDLPSITIRDQNLSLDLPEITSSQERIVFDVPDVRMVDRKVGQYPEIHGWTIIWKDIIISVPEPYMRREEIIFDLPSITMRRKDFVLGLPEITMQQQKWVITLPQFTVINVSAQTTEIEDKGKELKSEGEQLASEMKSEIQAEVAKYTSGLVATAFSAKNEVSSTFDKALNTVKEAISSLEAKKCDPIKVPTENGDVNLRKVYEDLTISKEKSISEIDEKITTVQ